jgi:hypothetical protein
VIAQMRGLLKRRSLGQKVSRAIDSRVGFYEATFDLDSHDESLDEPVIAWVRQTVAGTGRPYGVDYLTLALALVAADGSRIADATFRVLRPADFYDGGEAYPQITSRLAFWRESHCPAASTGPKLHAVLFSWGDLTSNLLQAS